jgi:hypothetical protein
VEGRLEVGVEVKAVGVALTKEEEDLLAHSNDGCARLPNAIG